jgi:hypothetical protein
MTRTASGFSALLIIWAAGGCVRAQFASLENADAGRDVGSTSCVDATTPVAGCQAKTGGLCDPVCQSGTCDWCGQKCSLDKTGAPACVARGSLSIGQTCTIFLEGTAQQRDECRAGGICLTPNVGGSVAYCFALCRSPVDCPGGVACAARPLGSGAVALVCDPEYTTCDPAMAAGCCDPLASDSGTSGCGNGRFCYLTTPDPAGHSRTMCEYATGGKGRGEACQSSRECLEKYVCVPSGADNSGTCQRVCSSSKPCSGSTCVSLGSEFGYCPV